MVSFIKPNLHWKILLSFPQQSPHFFLEQANQKFHAYFWISQLGNKVWIKVRKTQWNPQIRIKQTCSLCSILLGIGRPYLLCLKLWKCANCRSKNTIFSDPVFGTRLKNKIFQSVWFSTKFNLTFSTPRCSPFITKLHIWKI